LRAELAGDERRVDRFFEVLRESHGGEARVTVTDGAGRLRPGEQRDLTCVVEIPALATAGRTYSGAWTIGDRSHLIAVDVAASARNGRTRVEP
jgi:hypothetical protein